MITLQMCFGAHRYIAHGIGGWRYAVGGMCGFFVKEFGATGLVAVVDGIM